VLWSLIGWSLVTAASGMMSARGGLLAMRLLLGLVESLFLPAAMALVAEYHPAKVHARGFPNAVALQVGAPSLEMAWSAIQCACPGGEGA
jgi:MFS family permease